MQLRRSKWKEQMRREKPADWKKNSCWREEGQRENGERLVDKAEARTERERIEWEDWLRRVLMPRGWMKRHWQ